MAPLLLAVLPLLSLAEEKAVTVVAVAQSSARGASNAGYSAVESGSYSWRANDFLDKSITPRHHAVDNAVILARLLMLELKLVTAEKQPQLVGDEK